MSRLIIGHTTATSSKIWVRASERWPVAFVDILDEGGAKTSATKKLITKPEDFHTSVVEWVGLAESRSYRVKVAFGKSKDSKEDELVRDAYTEGRFTTFPAGPAFTPFTFMLGSCNLHSLGIFEKPDHSWLRVSALAKDNQAKFMVHCGDQIYADIPLAPLSSYEHYRNKYLDAWEDCVPAKKLLTELPNYMILDDHEIVNDFSNDMSGGMNRDYKALANIAMKVYWEFQHSHNPQVSLSGRHYHYTFSHGAVQFFVMDTRFYRYASKGEMIDPVQEEHLLKWLAEHSTALKFIVTSVPFITPVKDPHGDKWCDPIYDRQRGRILQCILDNQVERVVFLTGDMHAACKSEMKISDGNGNTAVIHELMSSPINQITPDMELDRMFVPVEEREIKDGPRIRSTIDKASFYGNHSNVMAIEVTAPDRVEYRIYRTSKGKTAAEKKRAFTL